MLGVSLKHSKTRRPVHQHVDRTSTFRSNPESEAHLKFIHDYFNSHGFPASRSDAVRWSLETLATLLRLNGPRLLAQLRQQLSESERIGFVGPIASTLSRVNPHDPQTS